jgi:hypothetical protein
MVIKKGFIWALGLIGAVTMLTAPLGCGAKKDVGAGATWIVNETTKLNSLTVAKGGTIKAPEGKSLTMTVDGVETGQKLLTTMGVLTQIEPGAYKGNVVLTVTQTNPVIYQKITFPLRQALYLNETGIVNDKSVPAAATYKKQSSSVIDDITIKSTGECFNGIYVAGGSYTLNNVRIDFKGNGRNDFAGYGAAIVGTGTKTRLVLDHADIKAQGTVRTGIIVDGGSNVIVKNSSIKTLNGVLPADYTPSVNTAEMRGGLGGGGNNRATNLVGTNTRATYINSTIASEGWGALSLDGCTTPKLTVINSKVVNTGNMGGYGTYVIGDAMERFLGSEFNIGSSASVIRGGSVFYGDSTAESVAKLNKDLDLGLTDEELKSIQVKSTTVNSGQFGVSCGGSGSIEVRDGTVFNTKETVFLNKGGTVTITVDGSKGAQLNAGNGIILQMMDDDDPGPTMPAGVFSKPYIEPDTPSKKDASWDVTATDKATKAVFSNIQLKGDFYNSIGWGKMAATSTPGAGAGEPDGAGAPGGATGVPDAGAAGGPGGGPGGSAPGGAGSGPGSAVVGPDGSAVRPGGGEGGMPGANAAGANMALTFDNSGITGVISASEAHHAKKTIYMVEDYMLFSKVTNTVHAPINNGVIVSLTNHSTWTVTGTSYLTGLTIDEGSGITALQGYKPTMTVNGVEKTIKAGAYKGNIVITVTKS